MNDNDLKWEILSARRLLHTPVFDVIGQAERSTGGLEGEYTAIEAPDWVMVIPEYKGSFVTVKQWRHSSGSLSIEFPGGVVDDGEEPAETAKRELYEETGFKANSLTLLGSVSPNPALFKNRFHIYLAEDLTPTGTQSLDDDELLTCGLIPIDEVIASYGGGMYGHALMGTALMLYIRKKLI